MLQSFNLENFSFEHIDETGVKVAKSKSVKYGAKVYDNYSEDPEAGILQALLDPDCPSYFYPNDDITEAELNAPASIESHLIAFVKGRLIRREKNRLMFNSSRKESPPKDGKVKTAAPNESTKAEEKSKEKSPREALLSQYAGTVKRPKDSPPFFRLFNIRPGYKCRISEGARFLLAPTEGDSAIRMGNKYPDLLHYFCGDDDTEVSHMWAYFTKGSEEVDFFTLTPHEIECKCEEVKTDIVANQIICSQCTTANVELQNLWMRP